MAIKCGIAGVVLVLLVAGLWFAWHVVHVSLEAEETLHAELLAMNLLCTFVEQQHRWPENWDELMGISPVGTHGIWEWPVDIQEVQGRVEIDFDYDVAELERESPDNFSAITARSATYVKDDRWLARIKKAVSAAQEVANVP